LAQIENSIAKEPKICLLLGIKWHSTMNPGATKLRQVLLYVQYSKYVHGVIIVNAQYCNLRYCCQCIVDYTMLLLFYDNATNQIKF